MSESRATLGHAPSIEIASLTKVYAEPNYALKDVSLSVEPGMFVVLLGPSGSGKSTLLRTVAGLERPTGGSISFDGRVVSSAVVHVPVERRELSMVFQDYALWPHMTVLDNVSFALKRLGLKSSDRRASAQEMLERMGLGRLCGQYPSSLSGGEQQRVALARALVAHPGLLLFDEPLSNLDTDLRERLRVEIATLTRETGATTIYITHDQAEAFALADRIGVLEKGRLVQFGTPEEIYRSPATPFVARFTGLAGELPCVVEHMDATTGSACLWFDDAKLDARAGGALTRGDEARLLVRSASTALVSPNERERLDGGLVGHLRGVVRDVAFRGRGYDHLVEVGGGKTLAGVFHLERHERGAEVLVGLDADGCLVFPNSSVADSPSTEASVVEDLSVLSGSAAR